MNPSTFLLISWYYNISSIKFYADVSKLVHNIIRHEDFKTSHFGPTFSTAHEAEQMNKNQTSMLSCSEYEAFRIEDGWIKGSVHIPVPCNKHRFATENDARQILVDGIWYHQSLEVIKMAFTEPAAEKFHITFLSKSIGSLPTMSLKSNYIQKPTQATFSITNMKCYGKHIAKVPTPNWNIS